MSNSLIRTSDKKNLKNISFGLLSDGYNKQLLVDDRELLQKFAEYVVEIWHPEPTKQNEKEKKVIALDNFHSYFSEWCCNNNNQAKFPSSLNEHLSDISSKFSKTKEDMDENWKLKANPFLTILIGKSYDEGVIFQQGAKTASSVETSWGNWIEKIFTFYNSNISYIGAAGMDYIYGTTAYDVKSGPQVMNSDQVAHATTKRHRIREMSQDKMLKDIVGVNDFKVAIVYGNHNIANSFMSRAEEGLIIYGSETWGELTGDEFNAFDLYLKSIEYAISNGAKWTKQELLSAIGDFNQIFYGGDDQKYQILLKQEGYSILKNKLSN